LKVDSGGPALRFAADVSCHARNRDLQNSFVARRFDLYALIMPVGIPINDEITK